MKITFVTPPYDNTGSGKGSSAKINYGNFPPLGVLYLVGALRKHGHECRLIDASSISLNHDEILEQIDAFNPDLIGVSTMTPSAPLAYELVRFLKDRRSTTVILGGVHCNAFKKQVLEDVPELDAICVGEGEHTIVEYVDALEGRIAMKDVQGICFRDEARKIISNPPRPLVMDLDTLEFPARDILDDSIYRPLPASFKRSPVTSMITSRGCPYGNCTFCFEAGNHAFKFRRHSPEYVIREIEETILPKGIRELHFWDDIFIINKKWIKNFTSQMKKFDMTWSCYGWPTYVKKEMLDQIADAGCWAVFYGFESGDQKLLDLIDKRMTLEDSRNAAKWTHDAGMATRASFMLALPGETPELARKTVEFAIELDCTMAQFHPTFPESGTKLYEMARSEGRIIPPFEGRMKAAYVPKGYRDAQHVEDTVRWAYRKFYFRPRFFWKHVKQIRTWEDIIHYFNGFRFVLGLLTARKNQKRNKRPLRQVCHVEALPPGEKTIAR